MYVSCPCSTAVKLLLFRVSLVHVARSVEPLTLLESPSQANVRSTEDSNKGYTAMYVVVLGGLHLKDSPIAWFCTLP